MDYYKDEYVVRVKLIEDKERYFLQFLGSEKIMPEIEIDYDTYTLYAKEFSKPLRRQKYLKSTYCDSRDIEDVLATKSPAFKTPSAEHVYADNEQQKEINSIVETCTLTQQRRWNLRVQGLTLEEIAKLENCSHVAVRKSILVVSEKIRKRIF